MFGTSPRRTERTHRPTTEAVKERVLLRAPRTWGAEPVKSAVSRSPSMVIFTRRRTEPPPTPSSSMWSTKVWLPSGQEAISARTRRSV